MTIKFTPGKDLAIADALSRAFLPQLPDDELNLESQVHMVLNSLPISDEMLRTFQIETSKYQVLQKVNDTTRNGWPNTKQDFHGHRIHEGHLGIKKCKTRACQALFWPGMNTELTEMIQRCSTCQEQRNYQQKEPLIQHTPPTKPWEKVGTDLFKFQKHDYLVVVDYYSDYTEISKLENTTYRHVIRKLKSIFARHGTPRNAMSDNDPQFSSKEFKEFKNKWEFTRTTSSPTYPKSNGMAERAVQTIKQILKKAEKSGEDPYIAIQAHRACPDSNAGLSPAERLFGRKIRTRLPSFRESKRQFQNDGYSSQRRSIAMKQKTYHDRSAKQHPPIQQGSTVRMYKDSSWQIKARVIGREQHPRSYKIQTEEGKILRRNRRDQLQTKELFVAIQPEMESLQQPTCPTKEGTQTTTLADQTLPLPKTTRLQSTEQDQDV